MASTAARILKVNHGGEHGAVSIYGGQIAAARLRCPELIAELEALRAHEIRHEAMFLGLMPDRGARPCRLMWLWSVGGLALGVMTGLIGRSGVFVCTEAVERTVHRHLQHQLDWLGGSDPALSTAIADIQREEEGHLAWAVDRRGPRDGFIRLLDAGVTAVVEALIWLSTSGESARLAKTLRG